jgi:hypothetical protein
MAAAPSAQQHLDASYHRIDRIFYIICYNCTGLEQGSWGFGNGPYGYAHAHLRPKQTSDPVTALLDRRSLLSEEIGALLYVADRTSRDGRSGTTGLRPGFGAGLPTTPHCLRSDATNPNRLGPRTSGAERATTTGPTQKASSLPTCVRAPARHTELLARGTR